MKMRIMWSYLPIYWRIRYMLKLRPMGAECDRR